MVCAWLMSCSRSTLLLLRALAARYRVAVDRAEHRAVLSLLLFDPLDLDHRLAVAWSAAVGLDRPLDGLVLGLQPLVCGLGLGLGLPPGGPHAAFRSTGLETVEFLVTTNPGKTSFL